MTIWRIPVVFLFAATWFTAATAQTAPSIVVGLSAVSLGEASSEAVSALTHEYTVTGIESKLPKTDEWLISEKAGSKMPVGNLYARNGKVTGFSIDIEASDKPTAQNAFNFFFSLVGKLTKESRNHCTLTSGTNYLSGPLPISKAFVDFNCGPYYFYLLKNEFQDKDNGTVTGFLAVEQMGEVD